MGVTNQPPNLSVTTLNSSPYARLSSPLSYAFMAVLFLATTMFFSILASYVLLNPAKAATAKTLNYQARLMNASGAIVPDGMYNIEFKLYDAASAGTLLWTETRYDSNGVSAGNDNRVQVKSGYLTVYLGDITDLPSNIWGQQLWLTMNVGGLTQTATPTYDGEMTPRLRLTAVPAAYSLTNYNTATGFSSSLTIGGATGGNQSFVIPDQGAAGTYNLLTTAAAAGSYVQLQGATPGSAQGGNFNITGTGIAGVLQASTALFTGASSVTLGTTGTSSGSLLFKGSTGASGTLTLQAPNNPATYALTLPSGLGSSGDCLIDTNGSGVLGFASCGGSGTTLQGAYDADTDGSDTIIALTTADDGIIFRNPVASGSDSTYILTLDQLATGAFGGLSIQSAGTGNLLVVSDTTATARDVLTIANGGITTFRSQTDDVAALTVKNASASTTVLQVDTSNSRVGIGLAAAAVPSADLSFGVGDRTINVLTQTASNTVGGALTVNSGQGNGSGAGGALTIQGGSGGTTGIGGSVTVKGGSGGSTSGNAAPLNLQGGNSPAGLGGSVAISAGTSGGAFGGGTVAITTGSSAGGTSSGGAFSVTTGVGATTGSGGAITLQTGAGGVLGAAGGISLITGNSTGAVGGAINLTVGSGGSGFVPALTLTGGTTTTAAIAGGAINLNGGSGGAVAATGGPITIQAGAGGTNSNGGDSTIRGGNATGTGTGGAAIVQGGTAAATAGSVGGAVSIAAANGSSTTTGAAGGNVAITAGNAGGSGNNAGGTITLQAGNKTGTGLLNGVIVKNAADSVTAFSVQNAASQAFLTADAAGAQVLLGKTSALAGKLQIANATNANIVTITTAVQASGTFSVSIPSIAADDIFCLATLANCAGGGGGTTLQGAYTASTGGTTPEIIVDATRNGLDIQDADTTIGSGFSLLTVRGSATSSTLGASLFNVNGSGRVGINLGSTAANPTTTYDLSFGPNGTSTRTIGIENQSSVNTNGTTLQINSAGGNGTGSGGKLQLRGGAATATAGSDGGDVEVTGRLGSSTGTGGAGGTVKIEGGSAGGSGNNAGGFIRLQAGSSTGSGAQGFVYVRNLTDGINAFQVQNAAGQDFVSADAIGAQLLLGKTSTLAGKLQLANATNANIVTITTAVQASGSFNVSIPSITASDTFCLATLANCAGGGGGSTLQAAYTASTGGTTSEIIADASRGALDLQDRSTANGGTIAANLFNVRATAANDSTAGALLFGIGNTGLVTLQPSASLTNGQIGLTQTATFANATASGVVTGFQQNITVSSSTAATNRGVDLVVTDNSSAITHANVGIKVALAGSNTAQSNIALDVSSSASGHGLRVLVSGSTTATSQTCGSIGTSVGGSIAGCYVNSATSATGGPGGIYSEVSGATAGGLLNGTAQISNTALTGYNSGVGAASGTYVGVRGVSIQSTAAAYDSVGLLGSARAGSGATTYGGYFVVGGTASPATLGAALYATTAGYSTSTTSGISAPYVLQAAGGAGQPVGFSTGGTAGTGAPISLVAGNGGGAASSTAATTGLGGAIVLTAGNGGTVTSGTGTASNGGALQFTSGNGGNGISTGVNGSAGNITLLTGTAGTGGSGGGGAGGSIILRNGTNSTTSLQVQNSSSVNMLTVDTTNARVYIGPVAGDTVGTLLVVGNKTNAADPTGVEGAMYYNSNDRNFRCYRAGAWSNCVGGLLSSNTAVSGAITTSTTQTDFSLNYSMPANFCTAGRVIRWTASGQYTSIAATTLILRMKAGATVLATSPTMTPGAVGPREWRIEGQTICNAAPGAAAATETQGIGHLFTATTTPTVFEMFNTGTTNLATNGALTMQLSAQWGTNNASTITLRQFIVEGL